MSVLVIGFICVASPLMVASKLMNLDVALNKVSVLVYKYYTFWGTYRVIQMDTALRIQDFKIIDYLNKHNPKGFV